jgi:two-component sensor histidine kinase
LYALNGDYKTALDYYIEWAAANESIEVERNERSLRENELLVNVLQRENELAAKQQQQTYFLFALLLGTVLLGLLYRNYRLKQRTNQKLKVLNGELAHKNELLDKRNAENELLLKEIHHRVKNNLEIVSSLLALQSSQIDDPNTKDAMQEGQNRVQSIGIVHQKLYQGTNLGAIEMKDYFINLGESLIGSFGAEKRVTLECAMDNLDVDIDTAVSLGLIVNELLTNTLKYAFPEGQQGKVEITLQKNGDGVLQLQVSDNGVGKSEQIKGTGFGELLISLLTQQLNGTMQEEVKNGTRIFFDFKPEKAA